MSRLLVILSLGALLLWSCGPDKPSTCSGADPKFKVVLKLSSRPLPADTVVRVTYAGSAKEDFRLSDPDARLEVTFCQKANQDGTPLEASGPVTAGLDGAGGAAGAAGAAGAGGATSELDGVPALVCQLFTAGFTELEVSGTGFTTVKYELTPNKEHCTLEKALVLDDQDAG